jgi:hypothetical protein
MFRPASGSTILNVGQISMPPTASTMLTTPPRPTSAYWSIRMPVACSMVLTRSFGPPYA